MKYHQLFNSIPDDAFIQNLLICYGIKGLDDQTDFCKGDLEKLNTVQKVTEMVPEMSLYYIPCKAKIYILNDEAMTLKRTVTILWQFLKLYDYSLNRKERIIEGKKVIYYSLWKNSAYTVQFNECSILQFE
jgi:hypothetical protein